MIRKQRYSYEMGDLVLPCYSFIRESIIATNDLLGSIERDIEESRLFIRSRNDVQVNWTLLVDSLKTDNEILNVILQFPCSLS